MNSIGCLMSAALAIAVIVTGAMKIGDFIAASIFVYRRKSDTVSTHGGTTQVEYDWTPAFAWSTAKRDRWRKEGKRGTVRDRSLSIAMDLLFRAPALALIQALVLLLTIGTVDGYHARQGQPCVFPIVSSSASHWLSVAAGAVCVSVASIGVFSLLVMMLLAPSGNLEVNVGQYLKRTGPATEERRPFGSILIVPAVTIALFLSFAALYLALFSADHSAFETSHCQMDAVGMVYFSTSVGATVGFGDIVPISDLARLIAAAEVIFFVTLLALFIQTLRRRPRPGV